MESTPFWRESVTSTSSSMPSLVCCPPISWAPAPAERLLSCRPRRSRLGKWWLTVQCRSRTNTSSAPRSMQGHVPRRTCTWTPFRSRLLCSAQARPPMFCCSVPLIERGVIPVRSTSIEQAIEINGAAVETNIAAFRWGRMWVVDRERVLALVGRTQWSAPAADAAAIELIGGLGGGTELGRVLECRVADLMRYQNSAYARRYVAAVRQVAEAEERVRPASTELAEGRGQVPLQADGVQGRV